MSNESEETRGGFHFGNVGRDVTMKAGGDIVGGNKETTTTTTTTIQTGFKSEEQKQEFQKQLDALREALREINGGGETSAGLTADEKDEVSHEILHHVRTVKVVKETTAELSPGQNLAADVVQTVDSNLE